MPNTAQSASWNFSPGGPITLTASFTYDAQDTDASMPVATTLTAIQGRLATATLTATQSDPATITVRVSI
jgi:hypothetical protein